MNWNRLGGLAFFAIALAGTTAAQPAPMSCILNPGVPPIVRAEGLAELAGDVMLLCSGGTPTPAGAPVPQTDIQIYLNTNITSRVTNGLWSEALLLIDEPGPGSQRYCTATVASSCGAIGVGDGDPGSDGPDGVDYDIPGSSGVANIFQGRRASANSIVFSGVPIDPSGPARTRMIRITNVRANASQLGAGTLIPSQIVMFVSSSGPGALAFSSPQATVGFVVPGQTFSVRKIVPEYLQCLSFNRDAATDSSATLVDGLGSVVRFTEGFAAAFRSRTMATGGADDSPTPADQNFPGMAPMWESGFYNSAAPTANGLNTAGLADHGTRLMARFSNIPDGMVLYASIYPVRSCATCGLGGGAAITAYPSAPGPGFFVSFARLISTNANGEGAFAATPGTAGVRWGASLENTTPNGAARIPVKNGSAVAVWEVLSSVPFMNETFQFGISVAYQGLPGKGAVTATATGGFAPLSNFGTQSAVPNPSPRFTNVGTTLDLFTATPSSQTCPGSPRTALFIEPSPAFEPRQSRSRFLRG